MTFASNWNLPPGCTPKMIEDHFGGEPSETSEKFLDQAHAEMEPLSSWHESARKLELCNLLDLLDTEEAREATDLIWPCGNPSPVFCVNNKLRSAINAQIDDWIVSRAEDLAEAAGTDERERYEMRGEL